MKRSASAVWRGGLKDGKGSVSTDSGALSGVPYNFRMRFENEKGTNPEELVAAAHAACFSMALSLFLGDAGMTAESIETKAIVTLDQVAHHLQDLAIHLLGWDVAVKTCVIHHVHGFAAYVSHTDWLIIFINNQAFEKGLACHASYSVYLR